VPQQHNAFKRIGLIAKPDDPRLGGTLEKLCRHLHQRGHQIFADEVAAKALHGMAVCDWDKLSAPVDLVIVLGGDGTLLAAARRLADKKLPLVGVNLGRLGFLVDISPARMCESLDAILQGKYRSDERFLLSAQVGDQPPALALNDVVLHKWNTVRMVEFETKVDGQLLEVQRADGIIISTPTGSTAYALAGGGPLLEPSLDAIALVPICPHRLSNRPIVLHGNSEITIKVCGQTSPEHVRVTLDGQEEMAMKPDDCLVVRKHVNPVQLFHPLDHSHYELLRVKLGWGVHPK